jgi:type II secretory pathway component GspD/PulD (secretin)
VDDVPDDTLRYDIGDPKPFRQVWDLVLRLNDLVYVLQPNDVVIVGNEQALAPFLAPPPEPAEEPAPRERRFYEVRNDPSQVVEWLSRAVPGIEVQTLPGTDTILAVASDEQHARIEDVLARLDTAPAPEPQDSLGDQAEPVQATDQRFYEIAGDPARVVELLNVTVSDAKANALPGTDSIVVVATAEQHARVEEVLARFDTAPPPGPAPADVVQRVYRLQFADATELASLLNETNILTTVRAEEGASTREGAAETDATGTGVAAQAATTVTETEASAQFVVVGDPRTNSLIVTATTAVHARFAEIIPLLDVAQQRVNVQVRIQEINRRTANNLGINITGASGNLAATMLDTGLSFVFDAQQAVSGLNIGAVLDTLETQGLSRRVDDANVSVLSGEEARIQSGGRIEIQFPSGEGELATRTIEFGVIVTVEPRVIADGRVSLAITAEVSDVLVPLSEGGIPERIDFSERQINSTVVVEPGETLLLGGLLQNVFSQTESRVPVLGSIPIIGALFGTTETENENSDLLLVVNANVVTN